jgi:3-isopropylmalate/(R)-2-methylmalate dehydratase large subunit
VGRTVKIPVNDPQAAAQLQQLVQNCAEFGVPLFELGSEKQGIVHVIGPEQGLTQPGMTIVCGDSHTSTHGAFGALAFGIGTSEVGHVLATQCLLQNRPKTMEIRVDGTLKPGVTAKDIILAIIAKIGTGGGTGLRRRVHRLGDPLALDGGADDDLQHVDRGRRAGRPHRAGRDDLRVHPGAPRTRRRARRGTAAVAEWRELKTDEGATYDAVVTLDATSSRR